jgi:hypothetical protein
MGAEDFLRGLGSVPSVSFKTKSPLETHSGISMRSRRRVGIKERPVPRTQPASGFHTRRKPSPVKSFVFAVANSVTP